ncbi:hypothetical protein V1514DRAFT_327046 [Lipomyces japonicus]|uniref:uncharacterized protein n=1 Tax=Lipomyces japonicus TaxID=56871 RepID=UPI0034CDDD22
MTSTKPAEVSKMSMSQSHGNTMTTTDSSISRSNPRPALDSSFLDEHFPPPNLPPGAALLDDRESSAYTAFLDKLALDSDFIFDPVLPDTLPSWPFNSPTSNNSPPPVTLPSPSFIQQPSVLPLSVLPRPSMNDGLIDAPPSHIPRHSVQLPLLSPGEQPGPPPLTFDSIRAGKFTVEDRASLLRAAQRKQGLAWGSDPRFQKSGFSAAPSSEQQQQQQSLSSASSSFITPVHGESQQITASEILSKMSQDGSVWINEEAVLDNSNFHAMHGNYHTQQFGSQSLLQSRQHETSLLISDNIPISDPPEQSQQEIQSSSQPRLESQTLLEPQQPPQHNELEQTDEFSSSKSPSPSAPSLSFTSISPPQNNKRQIQEQRDPTPPKLHDEQQLDSKRFRRQSTPAVERELLTDAQRRKNHISSEKKRRDIIKNGFDEICSLVPVLRAGGLSKSTVLQHVVEYIESLQAKKSKLQKLIEELERKNL